MTQEIVPAAIEALVYRVPIATPVRTSFGVMKDRPCVIVRITDHDGIQGWGEAWCNWPTVAAEYRARLIAEIIAPPLLNTACSFPGDTFDALAQRLQILEIQTGDIGPLAQALSGVDMALWDLAARKAGKPLCQMLNATPATSVRVYASGLNPDQPERLARQRRDEGHRAFKLKIGFDRERDLANIRTLRREFGADIPIAVDANMAFDPATALSMSEAMAEYEPHWFEEPLRADAPQEQWLELAERSPVRLAGGENLRGEELLAAIDAGALSVIQPDLGKWGGISGNLAVARHALAAGRMLCPHWLAGGIGLVASLHFLAASGGDGMLEHDANANALRSSLADDHLKLDNGFLAVPTGPGLGIEPDLEKIAGFFVESHSCR